MTEETRRNAVRMEYLCELIAVQGENLAKNLRELADISDGLNGFTPESLDSVRKFADSIDAMKSLADYMKGGVK